VADDWRERRVLDYEPDVIGGRLVVRPAWAPETGVRGGAVEIELVVGEGSAFGSGGHPTTRTVLEQLLSLPVRGSFADLGCGTGVLAVLAARLGWSPVIATDLDPSAVETTLANAALNGVAVDAFASDLTAGAPPRADGIAANVPASVHGALAAALPDPLPEVVLLSGFGPGEADDVLNAYAQRGLGLARRVDVHGWVVALLER
jgi:ribosomal protein L11 methyltransferase